MEFGLKHTTPVQNYSLVVKSIWSEINYAVVLYNVVELRNTYLLVLVVDERGSFSAIDAHIFPCLVQTVLEDVD